MIAKFAGQIARNQQIDMNPEQVLKFHLQAAEVEQRRSWGCVDQQIKIALFAVCAVQDGTEHAWIGCAKPISGFPDGGTVLIKGDEWLHEKTQGQALR